jgi:HAD superfamily hydrolase (TIGR01509 family)
MAWQRALDAGQRALDAGGASLSASDLGARRKELARERQEAARLLTTFATDTGAKPLPWLAPVQVTPELLGLPAWTQACLLDLDGVLADSGALHARAWGEVLDDLLLRFADRLGWQFVPFDPVADYRGYFDGRPRLEAIHAFLDSRGIRIPEGRRDDPASANTAQGVARRKGELIQRLLHSRGVVALPGAYRYLDAAGRAGVQRAVLSASASTETILEQARLDGLVDLRIDAEVLHAEPIRSRPAPDLVLYACQRLAVDPAHAVTITQSPAGVAAGHAAGLTVVGLGREADQLEGFGADRVAEELGELLDARLRTP